MQKIEEIIIVEGVHDIAFLSSFLDAYFIKTDGTSLPKETIDTLISLKDKGKKFIILTDPDYPGSYIRNKLLEILPEAYLAFVDKEKSKTSKKVGVEHSSKDEVLRALNNKFTISKSNNSLSKEDLLDLGLVGADNSDKSRNKITKRLSIGECNGKQFLKRMNFLNIDKESLCKLLKEINNE